MRSNNCTVLGTVASLVPIAAILTTGTDFAIPHIYASIGMISSVILGGIGAGITESDYWSSRTGAANLVLATFLSALAGALILTGASDLQGDAWLHLASWGAMSFTAIGAAFLVFARR